MFTVHFSTISVCPASFHLVLGVVARGAGTPEKENFVLKKAEFIPEVVKLLKIYSSTNLNTSGQFLNASEQSQI